MRIKPSVQLQLEKAITKTTLQIFFKDTFFLDWYYIKLVPTFGKLSLWLSLTDCFLSCLWVKINNSWDFNFSFSNKTKPVKLFSIISWAKNWGQQSWKKTKNKKQKPQVDILCLVGKEGGELFTTLNIVSKDMQVFTFLLVRSIRTLFFWQRIDKCLWRPSYAEITEFKHTLNAIPAIDSFIGNKIKAVNTHFKSLGRLMLLDPSHFRDLSKSQVTWNRVKNLRKKNLGKIVSLSCPLSLWGLLRTAQTRLRLISASLALVHTSRQWSQPSGTGRLLLNGLLFIFQSLLFSLHDSRISDTDRAKDDRLGCKCFRIGC